MKLISRVVATCSRGLMQDRGGSVAAFVVTFFACTAMLTAPSVLAEESPEELTQFGLTGTGAGQTTNPRGVASSPATGHVYVSDLQNQRIDEFTAWGEFVKAWGWGVVGGGAAGTGNLTANSTSVSAVVTTSRAFKVGQRIEGPGISAGTVIAAIGASTLTLSQAATESVAAAPLSVAVGATNIPVNEQQTVTLGAGVTAGNFKLTYTTPNPSNTAATTANIPYNASPAEVEAALVALANVGSGNVSVASANPGGGVDPGGPYTVIFQGTRFADTDVNAMTVAAGSPNLTGGTATLATTVAGASVFEICTSGCQAGVSGTGAGQFNSPQGVALDSSGDVYVVDQTNRRVQKFSPSGEFLLMFGGGVNKTTGANICTKAQMEAGNVCQNGTTGAAIGQFGAWKVGSFLAIDSADTVHVGDLDRIQRFNPDGTQKGEPIALTGCGLAESLAVDAAGNLWVACEQTKIPGIRKITPAGAVLLTIVNSGEEPPKAIVPKALATDSAARLYVVDGTSNPIVRKFSATGAEAANVGAGEFTASTGIGTNTAGNVYVSNLTPANSFIRAYGPLPVKEGWDPPPMVSPTIVAQYTTSVGIDSAVVKAEINPHFWPTSYYVQYGPDDCEANPCSEQPVPPGASLAGERQKAYPSADISLTDLTPGATYHFRFVAQSGGGGPVFGEDQTFTTHASGSFALPDERVFELVSPADENSAEVAVPSNAGGLVEAAFPQPQQAAPSGESVTYASFTAFGDAQSASAASQYLSRRQMDGWITQNISPRGENSQLRDPLRGFSTDLSLAAVAVQGEPVLAPGAVPGYENLYLRDNGTGALQALTTETPRTSLPQDDFCVAYSGASEGVGRVIFSANAAITPDAPEGEGNSLYEWSASQGLRLVSLLPASLGGTAAPPTAGTAFGAAGGQCAVTSHVMRNAISSDGSRIFWTQMPPVGAVRLMARLNGTSTIQLDAAQGGPGPSGGGQFWAASDDGSKVFFTSPNQLTADASAANLYRYDLGSELLKSLTPGPAAANVLGILGASDDGSSIYFVATGALEGAAVVGQRNLYRWHEGEGIDFITALSSADNLNWDKNPGQQTARVTPDGLHLAFLSVASLTGFDNKIGDGSSACQLPGSSQTSKIPECAEAYLYDAQTKQLVCASCNRSGARPLGPATVPAWETPFEQPRYLSDDGGRIFFESLDALVVHDNNGKRDVYEFEQEGVGTCVASSPSFNPVSGGCLYLISTGASGDESYFVDASSDARDVFISTRQSLLQADEDDRYDVYDARAGGGFPPTPPAAAPCSGEACRPIQVAPSVAPPVSSTFLGDGNVSSRRPKARCPKGKRRVSGGKTRCVKRHPQKAQHNRRAGR